MALSALLGRLDEWLARHAPATRATLNPPATSAEIAEAEDRLGFALLPEVVELWRWHNGCQRRADAFPLYPSFFFIGTKDSVEFGVKRAETDRGTPRPSWSTSFVPVADDFCGGLLVVDHEVAGHGRIVGTDPENGDYFWPELTSTEQMIEDVWAALSRNEGIAGMRPVVEAGELQWED